MSNIFVIGDLAAITSDGKPVPGVAPAAMQEGHHAARNISRIIRGEAVEPFRYVDKGTLASIGRAAAVAEIGRLKLSGFVAWMAWLGVHIFYLMGFRRRFIVMAEWAWLHLRNERGARLITGDVESLLERGRHEPPLPADRERDLRKRQGNVLLHDSEEMTAGNFRRERTKRRNLWLPWQKPW